MNLLLINHTEENQDVLLARILDEARQLGGCRCRLVHDIRPRVKHRLWTLGLPTAVVSMRPVSTQPKERFTPPWAMVWQQARIDKAEELRALEAADVRVPRWVEIQRGPQPDLSGFKDFVVVKPAHGTVGALVRVMRRSRVRWEPSAVGFHLFTSKPGVSDVLLAQDYIHTGPWPTSYRVGTVFGEPIYALRFEASRTRPPFEDTPNSSEAFVGRTIVAASKGSLADAAVPEDVIELAKSAHQAFPDVPVLGTDIVREHDTGLLYVLEVNAVGGTFHLTSGSYDQLLQERGIDLRKQFGGAAAVARGIHRRLRAASTAIR